MTSSSTQSMHQSSYALAAFPLAFGLVLSACTTTVRDSTEHPASAPAANRDASSGENQADTPREATVAARRVPEERGCSGARVKVFNAQGNLVKELIQAEELAGFRLDWDNRSRVEEAEGAFEYELLVGADDGTCTRWRYDVQGFARSASEPEVTWRVYDPNRFNRLLELNWKHVHVVFGRSYFFQDEDLLFHLDDSVTLRYLRSSHRRPTRWGPRHGWSVLLLRRGDEQTEIKLDARQAGPDAPVEYGVAEDGGYVFRLGPDYTLTITKAR
jgi:hypothetical protein